MIEDRVLSASFSVRDLGVYLDNHLQSQDDAIVIRTLDVSFLVFRSMSSTKKEVYIRSLQSCVLLFLSLLLQQSSCAKKNRLCESVTHFLKDVSLTMCFIDNLERLASQYVLYTIETNDLAIKKFYKTNLKNSFGYRQLKVLNIL